MRPRLVLTLLVCLRFAVSLDAQQVVFSHRAYAARGRSYQQIWIWSSATGTLTQVSRADRDHLSPACDADGRHILFDALGSEAEVRWRLDRATGAEERLDPAGASANPDETAPSSAPPACDADTASVSPDGTRVACAVEGAGILIADARTRDEIARVPFDQRDRDGDAYPPWPLESLWSPDGRTLLVANFGYGSTSTTPKLDYFLLDVATRTWTRAFTGNDAAWVTPTLLVFVTPRDLSPLSDAGTHGVWTAHLTAFDAAARTERPITSGLSIDGHPARCPR